MSEKLQKFEENKPEAVEDRPWVAPLVDVFENDNEVLLVADIPGVTQETLSINLDKDQLSIVGRVNEETVGTTVGREYQAVDYRRTFLLPGGIDPAKIAAELSQGVLHLHLPKSEAVKPRQIEVKAG